MSKFIRGMLGKLSEESNEENYTSFNWVDTFNTPNVR